MLYQYYKKFLLSINTGDYSKFVRSSIDGCLDRYCLEPSSRELAVAYLKIVAAGSPSCRWRGDDFKEFANGESVVEQVSSVWHGFAPVTIS